MKMSVKPLLCLTTVCLLFALVSGMAFDGLQLKHPARQIKERKTFRIHENTHIKLDASNCQFQEIRRCNLKFKAVFQNANTGIPTPSCAKYSRYCHGLQTFMTCLEESPCKGPFIGNYSFVVLQHGMMDKRLNICPKHDFRKLKTKLKAIPVQHDFIEDVINIPVQQDFIEDANEDESKNCSLKVHKSCVDVFTKYMETNSNMCKDVERFITCYEDSSKLCRSQITRKFANLCAKLGEQMLKANEMHRGMMC